MKYRFSKKEILNLNLPANEKKYEITPMFSLTNQNTQRSVVSEQQGHQKVFFERDPFVHDILASFNRPVQTTSFD